MKIQLLHVGAVLITIFNVNLVMGALKFTHWKAIALDITNEGEPADRGEFEAAKQAFLNISATPAAQDVAKKIAAKWEPTLGKEAAEETLLGLKRYPQMKDEKSILKATIDLFDKTNIKDFLAAEKVEVDISKAKEKYQSL